MKYFTTLVFIDFEKQIKPFLKTKFTFAKKKRMDQQKQFTENDRIFYADGYRLAQTAITGGLTTARLFSAIEKLYEAIDSLNDAIISYSEKQKISIACHKGCEWCCHQAVFANSYELHYLSEKMRESFSPDELLVIHQKCREKQAVTSKLAEEAVLKYKSPCPLLKDGSCSKYSARPMACRIYLSYKLESCLEFYRNPDNDANYPALLEFPLRAGQMMNEGFRAALKESGLETAEFRIEEGLSIVLANRPPDIE